MALRRRGGGLKAAPGWGTALPPMIADKGKRADPLYLSREWRALMRTIKAARGAWCSVCGAGGKGVRIIGDHIVEVKDGGAELDADNVQLMCLPCHNRKTGLERMKRRGVG